MRFTLGHVNDAVHVEGHLLGRRRPVLVAEAVRVSSVGLRLEGMIAVGDGASMLDVVAYGVLYLCVGRRKGASSTSATLTRVPKASFLRANDKDGV